LKAALENGSPLSADFGVLKFLATTFAAISGIPGGILAPSLAIGAGIGTNVASLFHGAPVAAIMLLGMVSYFAGVVQARKAEWRHDERRARPSVRPSRARPAPRPIGRWRIGT
jgi:hypothetical protein